jgi:hypothetical protein
MPRTTTTQVRELETGRGDGVVSPAAGAGQGLHAAVAAEQGRRLARLDDRPGRSDVTFGVAATVCIGIALGLLAGGAHRFLAALSLVPVLMVVWAWARRA